MYQLYESNNTQSYPVKMHPRLENLRRLEQQNYEKVQKHYRNTTYFTKGEHPLVTLLRQLPDFTGQDYRAYYYLIKDNYLKYASAVDFTCEQRAAGTKSRHNFTGDGYPDVIIGLGGEPFIRDWLIGWRDLEPIKVIRHGRTGLRYLPFDGRDTTTEKDPTPVVYTVDVPMLALQYILYRNYVAENKLDAETYTHFLMMYPLVNLLRSYNNQAVINRMHAAFFGLGGDQLVTPSIAVTDNHNLLDELIEYQLDALAGTTIKNVRHHMLYYPTLWGDGYQAVKVPDVLDVRPTTWAWEASKLSLIWCTLKMQHLHLGALTDLINSLKRSLTELESGRMMMAGNVDQATRSWMLNTMGDIRTLLDR